MNLWIHPLRLCICVGLSVINCANALRELSLNRCKQGYTVLIPKQHSTKRPRQECFVLLLCHAWSAGCCQGATRCGAGRHGQAMSTGWTGGQPMDFKKYALEHLVMLAGACNYTVDAPTTSAMKVLSNRVRCQQIQHDPCTWKINLQHGQ
jgi:hypothetical protein